MPLLEVCVDTLAGLRAAEDGGADRIELCSRLDLGGLSPDPELLARSLEIARLPLSVMVRPRAGGFVYSQPEIERMRAEISNLTTTRAAGVVFGVLTRDRRVDVEAVRDLCWRARPLSVTFHRAFDDARDPLEALDALASLSVDRVLTAGGREGAFEGRAVLRQLVDRSGGRVTVMAGGSVRAENAAAILASTGVRELHGSVPFRLAGT